MQLFTANCYNLVRNLSPAQSLALEIPPADRDYPVNPEFSSAVCGFHPRSYKNFPLLAGELMKFPLSSENPLFPFFQPTNFIRFFIK